MVEGAPRPRGLEHCHHARRKQERFEAPPGSPHGGGEGIRRCVSPFLDLSPMWAIPKLLMMWVWFAAENGLSFIETSALDASNVESAFQTILTGASHHICVWTSRTDVCVHQISTASSRASRSNSQRTRSSPPPAIPSPSATASTRPRTRAASAVRRHPVSCFTLSASFSLAPQGEWSGRLSDGWEEVAGGVHHRASSRPSASVEVPGGSQCPLRLLCAYVSTYVPLL